MPTKELRVTELDFNSIKTNLKNFLRGQDKFTDYDFEGASLNVLIDLLAYNTHYGAFYENMRANESFIDTAQSRASLASLVKNVGYQTASKKGALAIVDVVVTAVGTGLPTVILLPRNKPFTTTAAGKTYTFYTTDDLTATLSETVGGGSYTFSNVKLKEGSLKTFNHLVKSTNPVQYVVPNANVDTDTLRVFVRQSTTNTTTETFVKAGSLLSVDADQAVYWIFENKDGLYELFFGDGIIGKALQPGNVVSLEYIITNGPEANGANIFRSGEAIAGNTNISVTTVQSAFGGAERQDKESIRFFGPLSNQTQERAVTASDYEILIKRDFANIADVRIWGGEDNIPPEYGKVFISINTENASELTTKQIETLLDTLVQKYNVVSVRPVFAEPNKTFLEISSTVSFDPTKTILEASEIQTLVTQAIVDYSNFNLEKFGFKFRHSQLAGNIDDVDGGVNGNSTKIRIYNKIEPSINVVNRYTTYFGNELEPRSVIMEGFTVPDTINVPTTQGTYRMVDDGLGALKFIKTVNGVDYTLLNDAGTVDYDTGIVDIINVNFVTITDTAASHLELFAKTVAQDVATKTNQVLIVTTEKISITMVSETRV